MGILPLLPLPSAAQRDHQHCTDRRPIRRAIPWTKTSSKLPFQKAIPFPRPWPPALHIFSRPKQQIQLLLWSRLCMHALAGASASPISWGITLASAHSGGRGQPCPPASLHPAEGRSPNPASIQAPLGAMSRGHFGAGSVANVVMCPFQLQLRDLFYIFFPWQPSL